MTLNGCYIVSNIKTALSVRAILSQSSTVTWTDHLQATSWAPMLWHSPPACRPPTWRSSMRCFWSGSLPKRFSSETSTLLIAAVQYIIVMNCPDRSSPTFEIFGPCHLKVFTTSGHAENSKTTTIHHLTIGSFKSNVCAHGSEQSDPLSNGRAEDPITRADVFHDLSSKRKRHSKQSGKMSLKLVT